MPGRPGRPSGCRSDALVGREWILTASAFRRKSSLRVPLRVHAQLSTGHSVAVAVLAWDGNSKTRRVLFILLFWTLLLEKVNFSVRLVFLRPCHLYNFLVCLAWTCLPSLMCSPGTSYVRPVVTPMPNASLK